MEYIEKLKHEGAINRLQSETRALLNQAKLLIDQADDFSKFEANLKAARARLSLAEDLFREYRKLTAKEKK